MADHIFISYSHTAKDKTYAHKLADHLRQQGFRVWIDNHIDFGDRWWRTVSRQVCTCAAFVVVMTPEAEESEWVEQLTYVGHVVLTADAQPTVQQQCVGVFSPPTRYGMPVVYNLGGQALHSDAVEMYVALVPIVDEVQ